VRRCDARSHPAEELPHLGGVPLRRPVLGTHTLHGQALPRDAIDGAVWSYFETVGLDYDAMVREDDERRSLQLAEIADRIAEAERELATVTSQLARIRRDYSEGRLDAADWQSFRDELGAERDAAAAALEQLHAREQAVHRPRTGYATPRRRRSRSCRRSGRRLPAS
jgi:hypothetical protein